MERRSARGPAPDERGSRRRAPGTPAAPREPIGRDRAARTAPVRRPAARTAPPAPERPELPPDHRPDVPPSVRKEVQRRVAPKGRARDVLVCLDLGTAASESGDHDRALLLLRWAKHLAPRLPVVREALGIALYRAEEYRPALTELQAYRRLTGAHDQNHLIADCLRASDTPVDEVVPVAVELLDDATADPDRRVEAALVAAGALEDAGRRERARDLLRTAEAVRDAGPEARSRRHWLAADLAERAGDRADAVRHLDAILALGPDDEVRAWRERLSPDA